MTWLYPCLMGMSLLTGVAVSRLGPRVPTLAAAQRLAIALGAFTGGMIGAKLPFVLADWDGFLSGMAWLDNGKTIMTGLVGGYAGVVVMKWILDIKVHTGDSLAAPVAGAIAVGRLACFSAGCCYGVPTDLAWGVDFGDGIPRHPTQIYEFLFHGVCCVVLLELRKRQWFQGQLVKLYILAYLCYRFITESIRPEPRMWANLTAYQWTALALVPVFVFLWLNDARRLRKEASVAA